MLGTHVLGRPDHQSRLRHLLRGIVRDFGDAEVDDLHEIGPVAAARDHDVVGLEIAMDDPHVVRDGKCVGCLTNNVGDACGCERPLLLDQFGQRRPVDELHREIDDAVGLTEVVHISHVRMVDATRVRRLTIEAADRVCILHHRRIHDLERAPAPHLHMLGEVHLPHAALA